MSESHTPHDDLEQDEQEPTIDSPEHSEAYENKAEKYARFVTEKSPTDSDTAKSVILLLSYRFNLAVDELKNCMWSPELKDDERKQAIKNKLQGFLDASTAFSAENPNGLTDEQKDKVGDIRGVEIVSKLSGISANEREVLAVFLLREEVPSVKDIVTKMLDALDLVGNSKEEINGVINSTLNESEPKNPKEVLIKKGEEMRDLIEQLHPDLVRHPTVTRVLDLKNNVDEIQKNIALLAMKESTDVSQITEDDCTVEMAKNYFMNNRDLYNLTQEQIEKTAQRCDSDSDAGRFFIVIQREIVKNISI